MAALPAARSTRPCLNSSTPDLVFQFLAPSVHCAQPATRAPVARFSTSPALWKRDNNKNRGLSILRSTGPRKRQTLSVKRWIKELPKPAKLEKAATGDKDHGLWQFFHDGKLLRTPQSEAQHGRAWTVPELRKRTWHDLHSLWWVCVKERNRLATEKIERHRMKAGYGDSEATTRDETVQETMQAIQDTLLERHNAWEEACRLAAEDPDIDLERTDGPQWQPREDHYEVDELEDAAEEEAAALKQKEAEEAEAAAVEATEKSQKEGQQKDKHGNPA